MKSEKRVGDVANLMDGHLCIRTVCFEVNRADAVQVNLYAPRATDKWWWAALERDILTPRSDRSI